MLPHDPTNIVPGGEAVRAEFARHGEQIGELGPHVALDAGDRRAPGKILVREIPHHVLAKGAFVVVHVMRDAQPVGHGTCIGDIVAGAARALSSGRCPVIV